MERLVNFGKYIEEVDKAESIEELKPILSDFIKSVQKEYDELYKHALGREDVTPSSLTS